MAELGSAFRFRPIPEAIVESVNVSYSQRDFTRVSLELIVPRNFGLSDVGKLDLSKIFQSPAINKAINQEIERQTRKISFEDR